MSDEIHLTLRPLPRFGGNSTLRLRHLLKAALRSYGFQCTRIEGDGDLAAEPEPTAEEKRQKAIRAVFGEPAKPGNQQTQQAGQGEATTQDNPQAVGEPERGTGHLRGFGAGRQQ